MSNQAMDSLVPATRVSRGPTGAQDDVLAFASDAPELRAAWERWIDRTLIEWGRDPSALADADVTPPSREVIAWAIEYAQRLAQLGLPAANRVAPNGDGGIVFERWSGDVSESIEIEDDGCIYYSAFDESKLVDRQLLERMRG